MQLEYVDVVFANRPDSNTPMEGELGHGDNFYGSFFKYFLTLTKAPEELRWQCIDNSASNAREVQEWVRQTERVCVPQASTFKDVLMMSGLRLSAVPRVPSQ